VPIETSATRTWFSFRNPPVSAKMSSGFAPPLRASVSVAPSNAPGSGSTMVASASSTTADEFSV
jgi:hypothetical protein